VSIPWYKAYLRRESVTLPGNREHDDGMGRNLPHELGDEECNFKSEDGPESDI